MKSFFKTKTIIILTAIILVGGIGFLVTSEQKKAPVSPVASTETSSNLKEASSPKSEMVNSVNAIAAESIQRSISERMGEFNHLKLSELEARRDEIGSQMESTKIIERANRGVLSSSERNTLRDLIRDRLAISSLIIEKKFGVTP